MIAIFLLKSEWLFFLMHHSGLPTPFFESLPFFGLPNFSASCLHCLLLLRACSGNDIGYIIPLQEWFSNEWLDTKLHPEIACFIILA